MVGVNRETTITTKVSHWTKFIMNKAKGYAPNADGSTPNQGQFMEMAVALKATVILKSAGEYDLIKKNYEDLYGPVEEIIDRADMIMVEVENGEEVEAANDPYFEKTQES